MRDLTYRALVPQIQDWLEEDDLVRNHHYLRTLPQTPVKLALKIKSPLTLAGVDYFIATFVALGGNASDFEFLDGWDGREFQVGENVNFPGPVPFSLAVTAERLSLNLLQHASSIATWTKRHVRLAKASGIRILDTRKTTPGLRSLEKYAVRLGGGHNHRLGQTDLWMIKDNHKTCLGGLRGALDFFKSQGAFYTEIIAEIHDLTELREANELGIRHLMLDNFTLDDLKRAVKLKAPGSTLEVSGGIRLETLEDYLIPGIDAISIGALTYSAPRVDLSLKYGPA